LGASGVKSLIYFEIVATSALAIARAVTNLIGNGVATIAIAKWDNASQDNRASVATH
jgi:Na+/H+-dicarboxylate symporter